MRCEKLILDLGLHVKMAAGYLERKNDGMALSLVNCGSPTFA